MPDRVLFIEDDALSAAVVGDWLRDAGYDVVLARTGDDGLRCFRDERPAAVIADMILPGLDGATLCGAIRLQPFGARVPIILVSARASARAAALAARADRFLDKPLDRGGLLLALSDLLRSAAQNEPELDTSAPVRVPAPSDAQDDTIDRGEIGAGWFLPVLLRLHNERFTGVLEAESPAEKVKLFFHRGQPAAARSSDEETGLGKVLDRLGILPASTIERSVEESRRTRRPLGEVLLDGALIDRAAAERALREQVLLRAVGAAKMSIGSWRLSSAEPLGLAGFEVPAAAVAWRADPTASPPASAFDRFVQVSAPPSLWHLLDPVAGLGPARALLIGGAPLGDCIAVGGPEIARLIGCLIAFGIARLTDDPPSTKQRDAGLAQLEVDDLNAALDREHRVRCDADHYTALGVPPDASAEEILAATAAALALFHAESLPAGLDGIARTRAAELFDRVMQAGRVLGDPGNRAIYDGMLRRDSTLQIGDIGMEDHAVLQAERAREFFKRGEFVTAAGLFQIAVLLEGETPDMLAMLGWARHRACPEDTGAGEPELRRALALDADDEFALYYLGRLLAERGERGAGLSLLRQALSQNHEFGPARDALKELGE